MKRIFVDTDIIVDLIADRKPFSKFAIDLFTRAEHKKVKLFTSSHSIATTHYLLKRYVDEKELRNILYDLTDYITIIPVEFETIKKGLRSKHRDFEDALQIICAYSVEKIDCILTRNIKDFKDCEIPVLTPDELYEKL